MLASMTGYGRRESEFENRALSCELRSVNHRFLELSIRMPEELRVFEPRVRERLARRLKRGKIEVGIRMNASGENRAGDGLSLDTELAAQVVAAVQSVATMLENPAPVDPVAILSWPGVVNAAEVDQEKLGEHLLKLVDEALDDFIESRLREGEKTRQMLVERLDSVETLVAKTKALRPLVIARQKEKLTARLAELRESAEPSRLEQELVFAAQRLDVDEELDRLAAHVGEMRQVFERKEPVGRRLDFLLQEFNREANTLGSKSADVDTTGCSVELKVVIEQMREQIQNIE